MKRYITYRQTFLHSITPTHHSSDIHCIDFIKKSSLDWYFMKSKVGNVAFDNSKERETDFKLFREKVRKYIHLPYKMCQDLKEGGGGGVGVITLYFTTPRFKYASTVAKTLFRIYKQV